MTIKGRPIDPASWAAGNYPTSSNAWSNTPKRVANSGRYFTPKNAGSPQEVNDAIGELNDNLKATIAIAGQHAALNWPSGNVDITVGGSLPAYAGLAWDNKYGRWLAYGSKSGTVNANCAYVSSNGGRTWTANGGQNPSSGAADGAIRGVIYNPTTGRCAVCSYSGASGTMDPSAITDEEARITTSNVNLQATGIVFNGLYIFAGRNGSSTPFFETSSLGANVWSPRAPTFASPSTWCSTSQYAMASSGTMVLCVTIGVANYSEYAYSTNGTTWTVASQPTNGAGWANVGLCWAGDRFVLTQSNGTDSRTVTTQDGVTWFAGGTFTGVFLGGSAAIGSLIFWTTYTHFNMRGAWSTDGGNTIQMGGSFDITPGNPSTPDYGVVTSGSQFAVYNSAKLSLSSFMCVPGVP